MMYCQLFHLSLCWPSLKATVSTRKHQSRACLHFSGFFIEAEPGLSTSSKTKACMVLIKTSTFPRLQTSVSITSSHGVVSWHSPQPQSLPQIPASIFTAQQVVAASSLHCSRQSSRSEPSLPGRKNQGRLWATQKPGNTGVMRDKHTNSQRKDLDDKKSW